MKASKLISEVEGQPKFADDPQVHALIGGKISSIDCIGFHERSGAIVVEVSAARETEQLKRPDAEVGMPDTLEKIAIRALRDLAAGLESGNVQVSTVGQDLGMERLADGSSMLTGRGSVEVEWKIPALIAAFEQATEQPEKATSDVKKAPDVPSSTIVDLVEEAGK